MQLFQEEEVMQCTLSMEAADPEKMRSPVKKRIRTYLMDDLIVGYTAQFRFIEGILPSDYINMAAKLFAEVFAEIPTNIRDDLRDGKLESLLRYLGVYK